MRRGCVVHAATSPARANQQATCEHRSHTLALGRSSGLGLFYRLSSPSQCCCVHEATRTTPVASRKARKGNKPNVLPQHVCQRAVMQADMHELKRINPLRRRVRGGMGSRREQNSQQPPTTLPFSPCTNRLAIATLRAATIRLGKAPSAIECRGNQGLSGTQERAIERQLGDGGFAVRFEAAFA